MAVRCIQFYTYIFVKHTATFFCSLWNAKVQFRILLHVCGVACPFMAVLEWLDVKHHALLEPCTGKIKLLSLVSTSQHYTEATSDISFLTVSPYLVCVTRYTDLNNKDPPCVIFSTLLEHGGQVVNTVFRRSEFQTSGRGPAILKSLS